MGQKAKKIPGVGLVLIVVPGLVLSTLLDVMVDHASGGLILTSLKRFRLVQVHGAWR